MDPLEEMPTGNRRIGSVDLSSAQIIKIQCSNIPSATEFTERFSPLRYSDLLLLQPSELHTIAGYDDPTGPTQGDLLTQVSKGTNIWLQLRKDMSLSFYVQSVKIADEGKTLILSGEICRTEAQYIKNFEQKRGSGTWNSDSTFNIRGSQMDLTVEFDTPPVIQEYKKIKVEEVVTNSQPLISQWTKGIKQVLAKALGLDTK